MIRTKHINDSAEVADGFRVLTTRHWPRGVGKKNTNWDRWRKALGPSTELLTDKLGNGTAAISWSKYCQRFFDEMDQRGNEALSELREAHEQGQAITLLCDGEDDARCHRRLVKQVLEQWEQWFDVPEELRYPDKLEPLPPRFGSYILEFELDRRIIICPGALGRIPLGPGRLRYYGSAFGSGGLRTRVGHHLGKKKTLVGHADWLTVKVTPTRVMITDYLTECGLCQRDLSSGAWEIAAEGFGTAGHSRDCRAHLLAAVFTGLRT